MSARMIRLAAALAATMVAGCATLERRFEFALEGAGR